VVGIGMGVYSHLAGHEAGCQIHRALYQVDGRLVALLVAGHRTWLCPWVYFVELPFQPAEDM
jgi:hypothetical protein